MSIVLCCLFGLPGSGKSTFCRDFTEYCSSNLDQCSVFHIEYDAIEADLENTTDADSGAWDDADAINWKKARSVASERIHALIQAIQANDYSSVSYWCQPPPNELVSTHYILIDDNMYYISMRNQIYQLTQQYSNTSYLQIYFNDSIERCTVNNKQRPLDKQVPDKVIQTMATKLELPFELSQHTGHWNNSRFTIVLSNLSSNSNLVAVVIEQSSAMIAEYKRMSQLRSRLEESKLITQLINQGSFMHQLDIALKKHVALMFQHAQSKQKDMKTVTRASVAAKKKLLKEIKLKQYPPSVLEYLCDQQQAVPELDLIPVIVDEFQTRVLSEGGSLD